MGLAAVRKLEFPVEPMVPEQFTIKQSMEIWEKINDPDLLDDDTCADPTPFFASIASGQTLVFSLAGWSGLAWVYGVAPGRSACINLTIWDSKEFARRVGPMHSAILAGIEWIMDQLDVRYLRANVSPNNEPSKRLVERLGFKLDGRLRGVAMRNGELQDVLAYSLERSEIE